MIWILLIDSRFFFFWFFLGFIMILVDFFFFWELIYGRKVAFGCFIFIFTGFCVHFVGCWTPLKRKLWYATADDLDFFGFHINQSISLSLISADSNFFFVFGLMDFYTKIMTSSDVRCEKMWKFPFHNLSSFSEKCSDFFFFLQRHPSNSKWLAMFWHKILFHACHAARKYNL